MHAFHFGHMRYVFELDHTARSSRYAFEAKPRAHKAHDSEANNLYECVHHRQAYRINHWPV